jgi:hypothetical protein
MSTISKNVRICDYELVGKCERETVIWPCGRCGSDYCDEHASRVMIDDNRRSEMACCQACAKNIERDLRDGLKPSEDADA